MTFSFHIIVIMQPKSTVALRCLNYISIGVEMNEETVTKIINKIYEQGITVFLVEQNVHQTLAIAHYGYVLSKGRVVAEGESTVLAENSEVREAYFG